MTRLASRDRAAALAGLAAPLALTAVLIPFRAGLPNTDAALALVLLIVAVAATGRRAAGIAAAASAAVWFDFFLTLPYERLTITRRVNIETTILILAVGIAVTEIAVRGRRQQAAAARRAGYLDGISAAARAVAAGADPRQLTSQLCDQLTRLLGLAACRFQNGAAGIGSPARLLPDGRVVTAGQTWDTELAGLPPGRGTELLAEAGGLLLDRQLLLGCRLALLPLAVLVPHGTPPATHGPRRVHRDAALQLDDLAAAPGRRTAVALASTRPRPAPKAFLARVEGFAAMPGAGCGESVGILTIAAGA
jgi:Domain of unknown function (DUF4118)